MRVMLPKRTLLLGIALITALTATCARAAGGGPESPEGFVEMPEARNGEWILNSPYGSGKAWGRKEMIRHLWLVCREWQRRFPDRPRVRIGDISKPDGSPFPPHSTHTHGLAVDIKTRPQNIVDLAFAQQEEPLQLAELFYTFGATSILYGQPHALDGLPIVVQTGGHDTHFHVVVNPANVPSAGDWVFMPSVAADGAGSVELSCELLGVTVDGTGGWCVVPPSVLEDIVFLLDDMDDANGMGETSRRLIPESMGVKASFPLADGQTYRWRVQIITPSGQCKQSSWYVLETPKKGNPDMRISPLGIETVELPVHFTVLTKHPGAHDRITSEYICKEIEALNKEYAEANPGSKVSFLFASVCGVETVLQSGSPFAAHIDAREEYEREVWRSQFNTCSDARIVCPSAINVFIRDAYTAQRGFASLSSWVQRNSGRPYVILDWKRTLNAGLLSAVLPNPVASAQSLRSNPRILRDRPEENKTDNQ